jgi:anti-anti-sigma factor
MTLERLDQNGTVIFVFEGRLDTSSTKQIDDAFTVAFGEGARRFIWDFEKLTYISSDGLRSILQSLKRIDAEGGHMAICAPKPMVMEVFSISGFKSLLTILPDREAALRTLA